MRLLAIAAAAFTYPATAMACPWHHHDDQAARPAAADPWASSDESVATDGDVTLAPPSSTPVMTPADDGGWCHHHGAWKHASWRWGNYEPRFAVGFAKGHLELRDSDDKVTQ